MRISSCVSLLVCRMLLLSFLFPSATYALDPAEQRKALFDRLHQQQKKKTFLSEVSGTVSRFSDSESIWIRIDDRRKYRKWTYRLATSSLDNQRQEIRIYLKYVSPQLSVKRGSAYNQWFYQKVTYEMSQIFYGREVVVKYNETALRKEPYRVTGMVYTSGTSLNLWLVQNGWSLYLLDQPKPKEHKDFIQAEQIARESQLGLWKPISTSK